MAPLFALAAVCLPSLRSGHDAGRYALWPDRREGNKGNKADRIASQK